MKKRKKRHAKKHHKKHLEGTNKKFNKLVKIKPYGWMLIWKMEI